MFLIKGQIVQEDKMIVHIIYNLDAPENDDIPREDGIIVDEIIGEPEYKRGVDFIHCVNPQTGEQFFEEVERPLTQEELQQELNEKIDLLLQMQLSMQGVI